MSDAEKQASSTARYAARHWPLVLLCALMGAAFVGLTVYLNAPRLAWQSEASLRVTNPTGLSEHPSPASAVAFAEQPGLLDDAVREVGARARQVGPASASIDPKDPTVVRLKVAGETSSVARRVADGLRSIVVSTTLDQIAPALDVYAANRDASIREAQQASALAQEIEARIASDPQNTALLADLLEAKAQERQTSETARKLSHEYDRLRSGVVALGGISTVRLAVGRSTLLGVLQGALLGALLGVLVVVAAASSRASKDEVCKEAERSP